MPCSTRTETEAPILHDIAANVGCPRCGAPAGQPCQTVRADATPIAAFHPERSRDHRELRAAGYITYRIGTDGAVAPMLLWRRRTQRAIIRHPHP